MKFFFIYTLFFIILFLGGCSPTNKFISFKNSSLTFNTLQNTKKQDFVLNEKVKALFFVTYLNNTSNDFQSEKKEYFLVGAYLPDEEEQDIFKQSYTITLNGKEINKTKLVDKNNQLFKSIALKNKWTKYYVLQFSSFKDVYDLNIKVSHFLYGNLIFKFVK